jgi:tight adherence protein C
VILIAAGFGGSWVARRRAWRHPMLASVAAVVLAAQPLTGLACLAVAIAGHRWRVAARATRDRQAADADVAVFADLVVLAVGAGLSLRAAVGEAAVHVVPDLRIEAEELMTAMDRDGVGPALALAGGRLAGLGRVASAAAASGAPLAGAVGAYASTLRHADHAAAVERARRLPVRMLLPLALLILPGFVVLAVGPAVLQSLARLGPIP